MALTATTTTLRPAWDEAIVPTLRKRLENESRLLAKRISAASISSDDVPHPHQRRSPPNHALQPPYSPTYQSQYNRPSAIPRPSMQLSRPVETNDHLRSVEYSQKRSRTLSQPSLFEPLQTPRGSAVTRSVSPQSSSSKPSRIPMKNRNGSISSNAQSNSTAATSHVNGRHSKDTYYAVDAIQEGPRHKPSAILNEKPPFPSNQPDTDVDSTRMSSESDERPFEHWYRGEVSRNGGVGELRIARRKEMLDIASFGHSTKRISTWVGSNHSRSTSGVGEFAENLRRNRRAGSVGPSNRESFYLDQAENEEMVFDETPLTDVEDTDPYLEIYGDFHSQAPFSAPLPLPTSLDSPETPTQSSETPTQPAPSTSRIPTPSRRSTDSPRTPSPAGPSQMLRGASETLQSTPAPLQPNTPIPWSQTPTDTRRSQQPRSQGKSPARSTPSSSKVNGSAKKSSKSPPVSMKRTKEEQEKYRRSIAVYPTPEGDDVENAIPVWTRPIEDSNWDDVVLPVVARKKGLDGQYEMNSVVKKLRENVTEPAPGTFGYDYSKYKPPSDYGKNLKDDPMVEFGTVDPTTKEQIRPPMGPIQSAQTSRTSSPLPFPPPSNSEKENGPDAIAKDEEIAGCCKCVIM